MRRFLRLGTDEAADALLLEVRSAPPWPLLNRYDLIACAWPDLPHPIVSLMSKYPEEIGLRDGAWVLPASWETLS